MRVTAAHDNVFDFQALIHPGTFYEHPRDVVADANLSLAEKRAILASWASDASAIASCPALRAPEGLKAPTLEPKSLNTWSRKQRRILPAINWRSHRMRGSLLAFATHEPEKRPCGLATQARSPYNATRDAAKEPRRSGAKSRLCSRGMRGAQV